VRVTPRGSAKTATLFALSLAAVIGLLPPFAGVANLSSDRGLAWRAGLDASQDTRPFLYSRPQSGRTGNAVCSPYRDIPTLAEQDGGRGHPRSIQA